MSDLPNTRYWAFISYSSKDRKWGQWLHKRLESYPIPKEFQGTELFDGAVLGKNLRPVFRDRDELSGSADLGPAIAAALNESRFLIVLCSPNSAKSEWVNKEIEDFKALGKEKHILALILDGEPNATSNDNIDSSLECFPPALRYPTEPLAGDLRKEGDGKERGLLKVVSGIAQLDFDKLYRRHERAQRRTRITLSVAALFIITTLTALSVFAFQQKKSATAERNNALAQTKVAEVQTAKALANEKIALDANEAKQQQLHEASIRAWNEAEKSYSAARPQEALAYLAEGMRNAPKNTDLVSFAGSIIGASTFPLRTLQMEFPVANVSYLNGKEQIIIAELIYTEATRYTLWDPIKVIKLDEAIVPTESKITSEQLNAHPWLSSAPPTRTSNNSENDELAPLTSPSGVRQVVADYDRIILRGAGISWTHPWFNQDDTSYEKQYKLPNTSWPSGYAWNYDGTRLVTSHGYIDEVAEQKPGRIYLWDFRQALGSSLLPQPELTLPSTADAKTYTITEVEDDADGRLALYSHDSPTPLWFLPEAPESKKLNFKLFVDAEEVIIVIVPEVIYDRSSKGQSLERPQGSSLTLQRRALTSGKVLAETTVKLGTIPIGQSYEIQIALHPKLKGYAILSSAFLVGWDRDDNSTTVAESVGPHDKLGWPGDLIFTPDGANLLAGIHRKLVRFSWPNLKLLNESKYHDSIVSSLAVNADSTLLISASGFGDGAGSSGYAQLWSLPELAAIGQRLVHNDQVTHVSFLGNGKAFISASDSPNGSQFRLWSSKTALPLTTHLTSPIGTGQSFLAFDRFSDGPLSSVSARGEIDSFGKGSFSTIVTRPTSEIPEWFYKFFIPFAAGREFSDEGSIQFLSPKKLQAYHEKVSQALTSNNCGADSPYQMLARWYLTPPSTRSVSLGSNLNIDAFLEQHFFQTMRSGQVHYAKEASINIDPAHPLLHIHLALFEKDSQKQRNLMGISYTLLSRPINEATYGKKRWHEQLRTGQQLLRRMGQNTAADDLENILSE